jgi:hypothetical protein
MIRLITALSLSFVAIASAGAQTMTVQSLLTEGYTIVSVMPSNAGPGIFLQKGDKLIVCFAAETPGSESVKTRYCKPVR